LLNPTLLVSRLLATALLGATLIPAAVSAAPAVQVSLNSSVKVHPLLQYGAQAEPDRIVRVIVQKTKTDIKANNIAARVPGLQISEEFDVIPAFVASVPQSAISLLAQQPGVRYVSPDGAVQVIPALPSSRKKAEKGHPPKQGHHVKRHIDSANLVTTYPFDTHATDVWQGEKGQTDTGAGIGVALIDSGVDAAHLDLVNQVVAVNVNRSTLSADDGYGHGTHVAGIINGHDSAQHYLGIAPEATVISVKVADDNGGAYESDLLRGLQWVSLNADAYNIKVLNLSVSVAVPQGYATSPVDAAVEHLWQAGITVVASAGNLGSAEDAVWYAPGNDPLVITVGCLDDNGTTAAYDDSLCPISSRGVTEDGFAKPDLIAPGRKIVSALAAGIGAHGSTLAGEFPDRVTPDGHIRLSGTSMSAPMVAGAVALLLESHPNLTPGQIKQILVSTTSAYPGQPDAAGTLNIAAALVAAAHPPANKTFVPVPVGGSAPPKDATTLVWDGARWGSSYWDGARWGSTYWDGARWGSSVWDGARWGSSYWDGARWGSTYWDGARWGSTNWDGARWGSAYWDGARWGSAQWDGARWGSATWDGARWGNGALD
jgi:serine protease AprX